MSIELLGMRVLQTFGLQQQFDAVEFLILPGQQAPQMLQRFRQLSAAALAPVLVKHPMPGEAQQGTNRWKHVTQHFIAIFLDVNQ